jgi:general secretion pathway protein J
MLTRHKSRGNAGFTLLEMMLAVAVLGIILSMLAESFHAIATSKVHASERLYTDRAGRAVMWELTREIRGAVQTPIVPSRVVFVGAGHSQFGNTADALSVSTLDSGHGRAITGFGAETIVSWSTIPNRDHPGWLILRRAQQSGLLDANDSGHPVILAPNLLALHLRYFDGSQWTENWDSTTLPPGRQLPVAVAIDMKMATPSGSTMTFSTQVLIPMSVSQW